MEITDPTDWPGSMPELRTIDNLLRCSICYEFLNTAMILPGCSHNFCSLCIRRYLSQESKCPSCKKPSTIPELKNNRVLDELVKNFVAVRPQILKLCLENDNGDSSHPTTKPQANTSHASPSPRRSTRARRPQASHIPQEVSSSDEAPSAAHKSSPIKQSMITKHFRSKSKDRQVSQSSADSDDDFAVTPSRRSKLSTQSSASDLNRSNEENIAPDVADEDCMIVDDDEGEASTSSESRQTPSKKAPCPVCGVKIHSKYINTHLDACLTKGEKRESKARTPTLKPKRKPLPKLVYNLMSDKDLRKKLKEFKMPHQGSKQVLIKRLQEFTLLYNAECDSASPKSVEALVKEVEKMEKVKVQQPSKREQNVTRLKVEKGQSEEEMEKHQKEYLKAHKNQYDKLIQDARERMKKVRSTRKKATGSENPASTSSVKVDDETSNDSVTITQVKDGKDAMISDSGSELENQQMSCDVPNQPAGAGQDKDLATVKTVQDDQTITEESMNNACVSLSFVTDSNKSETDVKEMTNASNKQLTSSQVSVPTPSSDTRDSSSNVSQGHKKESDAKKTAGHSDMPSVGPSPPAGEEIEQKDQGINSTEPSNGKIDESLEEPSSPSLLNSQAVLGDNANYSVSIHDPDNSSDLGHSGLLDTLMLSEEPGTTDEAAVLVPSSPSTTSKAGDANQQPSLEGSEASSFQDSVDFIPESPQPSTSGIRPRKRKKVEPSSRSESGSSVGDDSVGLRRSRRTKKAKPDA